MKSNRIIAAFVAVLVVGFFVFGGRLMSFFRGTQQQEVLTSNTIQSAPDQQLGFQAQDLVIGQGEEARPGDTLTVHYVGLLVDGRIFDSSLSRGEPFQFTLGAGQVIPGWEVGIVGMKVGGVRRLIIPPQLAYGDQAVGPIPSNSSLVFEVELLGVNRR